MSDNPPETTSGGAAERPETDPKAPEGGPAPGGPPRERPEPSQPRPEQSPPEPSQPSQPQPSQTQPSQTQPGQTQPSQPSGQPAPELPADAEPGRKAAPETETQAGSAGQPPPTTDKPRRKRRRRRRKGGKPPEGAPAQAGDAPAKRGRQRGPRSRNQPAITAVRSLSEMAQALLRVEGVDFLAMPRHMDIRVRVPMDAQRDGKAAAAAVVEQILQRVREVREHEKALVPGAVYCYFSNSAESETAKPRAPREVFDGYSSTGRPIFTDFVTMAIERKDPGIDALLGGDDMVLTHVTMGRVLRTQQLQEFGQSSPVFKILGQVDAGLFRVLGAEQKAAYSFQLLRGTTLEGNPRLRLHVVGAVPVMDLADPNVAQILSRFQRRLDAESLRLAGKESNGEVDDEEFVLPLLQELAKQLSGRARRQGRRTQHAVQRSDERQRPTTKAFADADAADDSHLLWDMDKGTVVVLGPRGRVHVFTPQARHVTSLMMQGSEVQKRRQQGRWRPAEPEERGEFRIQLRGLLQSGEAKTAPEAALEETPPPPPPAPAPAPDKPADRPAEETAAKPVVEEAAEESAEAPAEEPDERTAELPAPEAAPEGEAPDESGPEKPADPGASQPPSPAERDESGGEAENESGA